MLPNVALPCRSLAMRVVVFCWAILLPASVLAQVDTPAPGSPLRKAILDALRPAVIAELGAPLEFTAVELRVLGEWAFVKAQPQRPGGGEIEYLYTKYQSAWEAAAMDATAIALLRDTPSGWLLYEYVFGAGDVPWDVWPERYPVPPEVFPTY
jgi:hypothetical protein